MSGTALDHPPVRDNLGQLDAALQTWPAAARQELREQVTAHLDDALLPDAGDEDVAANRADYYLSSARSPTATEPTGGISRTPPAKS